MITAVTVRRRWSPDSACLSGASDGWGRRRRRSKAPKAQKWHFFETCGSPMGFEADHYPGGMHLYAASLEDSDFQPTFHVNYRSKLPWLQINDDLPKYEGTLLQSPEDPKGCVSK